MMLNVYNMFIKNEEKYCFRVRQIHSFNQIKNKKKKKNQLIVHSRLCMAYVIHSHSYVYQTISPNSKKMGIRNREMKLLYGKYARLAVLQYMYFVSHSTILFGASFAFIRFKKIIFIFSEETHSGNELYVFFFFF